ncbi:MAG: restriction endonuclease subunit S [Verrucomicrobiia bacterium]
MSKALPTVKLGEVLRHSEETIELQPGVAYRQITVKLWGKGVVLRGTLTGAEIAASRQMMARRGQFILSRIDARNGALGIVPPELDKAIVTNDFPVFNVLENRMLPAYLGWMCRTASFVEECKRASEGTTNRVRLQEDTFLAREIPLPPLVEQRRVVAQIEALAAQIHEATTLRLQAAEETERLMAGEEKRIWPDDALLGAPTLESVCTFLARGKQSEQGESDHFLIKTQHVQQDRYLPTMMRLAPHTAAKVKAEAIVQDGDTLIACSAAGCLGRVARFRDEGKTASTDTHVAIARANTDVVHSDYLFAYLRGAQGQHQLRSRERGDWKRKKISFRLTELNLNDLRKVPIPVPPLAEQRRIVAELDALQAEVDALKRLQSETAKELDALLPAILDRAFKGEL